MDIFSTICYKESHVNMIVSIKWHTHCSCSCSYLYNELDQFSCTAMDDFVSQSDSCSLKLTVMHVT